MTFRRISPETSRRDLLDKLLEGRVEPHDEVAIQSLLKDQAAAKEIARLMMMDDLLRQQTADPDAFMDAFRERLNEQNGQSGVSEMPFKWPVAGESVRPQSDTQYTQSLKVIQLPWLPWLITTAACFVALLSFFGANQPDPSQTENSAKTNLTSGIKPEKNRQNLIALMVNSFKPEFESGNAPKDFQFHPGAYHLKNGSIHLRLINGTDVIAAAPLKFELENDMRMRLTHGQLRAIVPENAQGFTIAAPTMDFEDLGTEFAVMVDDNTKESQLHVFSGQVDLREKANKQGKGRKLASLMIGEAVKVNGQTFEKVKTADPNSIPTSDFIDYQRWRSFSQKMRQDKDLIFYYDFEKGEDPHQLNDVAVRDNSEDGKDGKKANKAVHGKIKNTRWVTGRWPGKDGLLFDRDEDAVAVNIPGKWQSYTLMCWLRVDRLDFSSNAILDSNKWEPGDLHWQINRLGSVRISGHRAGLGIHFKKPLSMGQWSHIAVTYDHDKKLIRAYLNGKLDNERRAKKAPREVTPGESLIGNWDRLETWPDAPKRGLRGCMDEMAAWRRALTEDEIKAMVEAGRPTMLWASR